MSKIAPATKPATTINATKTDEQVAKKEKPSKPGLASHQLALRLMEVALKEASEANDAGAVRLLTTYVKNIHYKMRPWAKVTVEYVEK